MGVVVRRVSSLLPAVGSCLFRTSGTGSSPDNTRNWTTIACDLECLCFERAFWEGYVASQQPQ
eukprot:9495066-Pyramimonas_sp.AAC.1